MAEIQSGAENVGWAQVIPDYNTPLLNRLDRYEMLNEQHRKEQELKARQDKARQDELGKYLGDVFNNKDYATGTEYDPIIYGKLQNSITKYADLIKKNPDTSITDILPGLTRDVNEITGYAGKIKQLQKFAQDGAEALKKEKGIDWKAAYNLAMDEAIHKVDEKGNKILKDVDEIDLSQPYVMQALNNHPEKVLTDFNAWKEDLPKVKDVSNMLTVNAGGVKKVKKVEAQMYPFQNWEMKNGAVALEDNGLPNVVMTKKKYALPNGGSVDLVDDETYSDLMGNLKTSLAVKAQLKSMGIKDGTPAAELAKREILTGMLDNLKPEVRQTQLTDDESALWREQMADQNRAQAAFLKAMYKSAKGEDNTALQGNEFDRIGELKPLISPTGSGIKTEKGVVTKDGQPFTGEQLYKTEQMPAGMMSILKSSGIDLSEQTRLRATIKDGVIESITPVTIKKDKKSGEEVEEQSGNTITRQDMENAQLKYNSEPQKGVQPTFGKKENRVQKIVNAVKKRINW